MGDLPLTRWEASNEKRLTNLHRASQCSRLFFWSPFDTLKGNEWKKTPIYATHHSAQDFSFDLPLWPWEATIEKRHINLHLASQCSTLFFWSPSVVLGVIERETRPDTRLPKSRAGGQGPYLRPLHHLGRSSKAKDPKNKKKVKKVWRTDRRTDKAGFRVA